MTGLGPNALAASMGMDAMGFLAKPFTRQLLVSALDRGLDWHLDRVAEAVWSTTMFPFGTSTR